MHRRLYYVIAFELILACFLLVENSTPVVAAVSTEPRLTTPCAYDSKNFDPLRPDPFNPCDPLIINKSELRFSCSAGLTTNGSFEFDQVSLEEFAGLPILNVGNIQNDDGSGSKEDVLYKCSDDPTMVCALKRIPYDVTFDFSGAQLPVIGNTEIEGLDDATRMNAYLSSYLNGTVQQAEKNRPNYNTPEQTDRVITYSGPVKKLLPYTSQEEIKETVASRKKKDVHEYQSLIERIFANMPLSNPEDIVGEAIVAVDTENLPQPGAGGQVVSYKWDITKSREENINRIQLYIKKVPNPSATTHIPYSDGRLYLPHIRDTVGLAELLRNYALPYEAPVFLDPNAENTFRPIVTQPNCNGNQSAACKRLIGTFDKNNHQGDGPDGTGAIAQYTWHETNGYYGEVPTRNTEIIDNPIQLGGGNNRIVRAGSDVPTKEYVVPPATSNLAFAPNAPGIAPEPECSLAFSDSPGDKIVDTTGWQIKAKLTYTQVFRWKPLPPPNCGTCTLNGPACGNIDCGSGYTCKPLQTQAECYNNCITNGGTPSSCTDSCRYAGQSGTCKPADLDLPTKARVSLYTKTPTVDRIYEDLVSGFQSVLRRFMPGANADLMPTDCPTGEYIKGEGFKPSTNPRSSCVRPVTSTFKSATATGGNPSDNPPTHQSIADGAGSDSYTPSLIFPYLGSLNDYFLGCGTETLNLQNALRPQGMKSYCGATGRVSPSFTCPTTLPSKFATAQGIGTGAGIAGLGGIGIGPDSHKSDTSRQDTRVPPGRSIGTVEGATSADPGYTPDAQGVDPNSPNFRTLFTGASPDVMTGLYRVNGEQDQCKFPVNLVGFTPGAGTGINAPQSGYDIQPRVLYADNDEITFTYQSTVDGITNGYTIHILGIRVDPVIFTAYTAARALYGTTHVLPILNQGQQVGVATGIEFQVGIRDTGQLMDLRARADWWK